MIPVVTPDEMRAIDSAAPEPVEVLVERAGAAVARAALDMLGGAYGRTVAVIAGPGNNGADGRVAGERLRQRGASVRVHPTDDLPASISGVDLVIDAAFGTGFRGTWQPPDVGSVPVLAVDVPTGLDARTGIAAGPVLRAERTVTFAAAKPGHFLGDGPDLVGALAVADIGLPVDSATIGVVERGDVAGWVPQRDRRAHKWHHAVRVVAGSAGMTGAAGLTAEAAQRTGAGMVVASSPGVDDMVQAIAFPREVVTRSLADVDWSDDVLSGIERFRALVIGPGLGRHPATVDAVVQTVRRCEAPMVVDGDGLFALASDEGALEAVRARRHGTVLTPHDGEFALLTGSAPGVDRIDDARSLAGATGAVVLLKGAPTIVADPDGRVRLVTAGDQRLATAGTGDVLSGVIGALLAMGADPFDASAAGAWIHATAAAASHPHGMVAGDLIGAIPDVLAACAP